MRGVLAEDSGDADDAGLFNLTSTGITNETAASPGPASRGGLGLRPPAGGGAADSGRDDDDGALSSRSRMSAQAVGSPTKLANRSSKQLAANKFATVVAETATKARLAVDEGTEEHWNHVMKKLAPQGARATGARLRLGGWASIWACALYSAERERTPPAADGGSTRAAATPSDPAAAVDRRPSRAPRVRATQAISARRRGRRRSSSACSSA
jgi:hypothetical protein